MLNIAMAERLMSQASLETFIKKYVEKRSDPETIADKMFPAVVEWISSRMDLPPDIKNIIEKIKAGDITSRLESDTLETIFSRTYKVSNRIAFSFE